MAVANRVTRKTLEERSRPFTVEEYERMVEDGYFQADETRLELLKGRIVYKDTPSPRHVLAVDLVRDVLQATFGKGFWVRSQAPLRFPGADSEPEPDLAVVKGARDEHANDEQHPSVALLIVEVADPSTLELDREVKASIYAASSVADYWIVNLAERVVEVFSQPKRDRQGVGRYRLAKRLRSDQMIKLVETKVQVKDLLP